MTEQWNVKNSRKRHEKIVRIIRIVISATLAVGGLFIMLGQLLPLGSSYIKGKILEINEVSLVSPVPGAYKRELSGEFAYWDPGRSYFENLITRAGEIGFDDKQVFDPATKQYRQIEIDESYSTPMALTFNSLDIKGIKVEPNVESYNEDVYNLVLKSGLAHFKGTCLPGDGCNTFIYGHSAVDSYFSGHQNDPETIFTRLENADIGNEVTVQKDGENYTYIVRKKKIVEADDFSILENQGFKETLTLMTCYPNGIGTKRLVVTAELQDG